MKLSTLCAIVAPVAAFAAMLVPAPAAGWKAGVAAVDITPDRPMWMAGYANRTNASQGRATALFAKALALEDEGGRALILLSVDLIGVPRSLRRAVEAGLAQDPGLSRTSLLMNASHTHSGPEFRLDPGPQDWAMFGREGIPGTKSAAEYGQELRAHVLEAARRAWRSRAPASLSFQHARCGFAMNRRTPEGTNYNNFPNPDGPVDHDVPVLRVDDPDGDLRALVFGYACHNTTVALYRFCGDYAGYAQAEIERSHPGSVALFFQGCGGDQNPYPRGTFELAEQHGRTLASAVEAALQTRPRRPEPRLRVAFEEIELDYASPSTGSGQAPPARAEFEARLQSTNAAVAQHARRMIERFDREGALPSRYPYPVQVAQFGEELTLVALAGETCVDYSLRLKQELPQRAGTARPSFWIAGYCNDVMAYIPSVRLIREGGYEPYSSMFYSEIHPGPWAPTLEDRIIGKVHDLNSRLRRETGGR